ncbi:hypothetical protein MZM54_00140 [[Brevibacterium] frigoritolerans]|nr:hypothetical protein [Peribacillus frigoritolerans]
MEKGLTGMNTIGKTIEFTSYSVVDGEYIVSISFEKSKEQDEIYLVSNSPIVGMTEDELMKERSQKEAFNSEQIGASKETLFKSWVENLGYNKAVLLSCNYDVKKVVGMSEEAAESEVEAIGMW